MEHKLLQANRLHLPERGEMGGGSPTFMIDYRHRQGRFNEKIKERLEEYRGLMEEPFW